jgi:hypothetical protein
MGTLGDNLLKLTEFPFSYSFIGLLVLIFGQGQSFGDEEFFNRLGPLLILMGFVATTLSITDPIGALQKRFLGGIPSDKMAWQRFHGDFWVGTEVIEKIERPSEFLEFILSQRIFGHTILLIPTLVTVSLSRQFQDILDKADLDESLLNVVNAVTL